MFIFVARLTFLCKYFFSPKNVFQVDPNTVCLTLVVKVGKSSNVTQAAEAQAVRWDGRAAVVISTSKAETLWRGLAWWCPWDLTPQQTCLAAAERTLLFIQSSSHGFYGQDLINWPVITEEGVDIIVSFYCLSYEVVSTYRPTCIYLMRCATIH